MPSSTIPKIILATNNAHKLEELRRILERLIPASKIDLRCGADFPDLTPPEESGETFEANALIKAHAYARAARCLAIGDDSGLVVDALGGRPGVRSARYDVTPEARIARLLGELDGVEPARRSARFECAMALADPAGRSLTRRGTVEGRIAFAPRGDGGFGYDPIFEFAGPPHTGRTMAEIGDAEKDALSHRGRALAAIAPAIAKALAGGADWAERSG